MNDLKGFSEQNSNNAIEYFQNSSDSLSISEQAGSGYPYKTSYGLTYPQVAIWYTEKVYPDTSFGNIAGVVRIQDEINFSILERAIGIVIEKNDGMRLRIFEDSGEPKQYFYHYKAPKLDFFDFSGDKEESFQKWKERETCKPFELIDSDLYYFALFKLSKNDGGFYIKIHHIISDAWTMVNLIVSNIMEYYYRLKNGIGIDDENKPSYLEYILCEEEYKQSKRFQSQKEFWSQKFDTIPEFTGFKAENPGRRSTKAERKTFIIPPDMTSRINKFCETVRKSPFAFFMGVLYAYISRVESKSDIVVGTPVLNRANIREKETAGMFISVVPVRFNVNCGLDFQSHVDMLSKELLSAFKNQKYPHELILNEFREKHNVAGNLYDVVLSYQNAKYSKCGTAYEPEWLFNKHQVNALNIHISDRLDEGQYFLDFDYLTDMFEAGEIERMYGHMLALISDVLQNSSKKLRDIEILSVAEKRRILGGFNGIETEYPKNKTLAQLFEEQVEKYPDNTALSFGEEQPTYRQLNEKANKLARMLQQRGIKTGKNVCILLERSIDMVAVMLGVIKAGGAYIPVDTGYPEERICGILEDSAAIALISNNDTISRLKFNIRTLSRECEILVLDELEAAILEQSAENLSHEYGSSSIAYIMYTSGSTGKPKGTLITHYSITRIARNTNYIKIDANDTLLQLSNYAFDGSTFDIYGALLNGARLVMPCKEDVMDVFRLSNLIISEKITVFFVTTALFNTIVDLNMECLVNVRKVLFGGERVSLRHVSKALRYMGSNRIIHVYGPTESTVFATYHPVDEIDERLGTIPIGKPVSNTRVYILDSSNNLQPVGYTGEICISGDGLAEGYLNRPELTREKFVQNPFMPGKLMYRTGDLARWLPDGSIEFVGRMDSQVKLRGFRIELEEIESRLSGHEAVKEAIVAVKEDENGSRYLCAYYIPYEEVPTEALRKYLSKVLPDFMVPACFLPVQSFPLNSNGKVERRLLPKPDLIASETPYSAPEGELESRIAQIWEKVLGVEKIGVCNNFFESGGDSLKAITIAAEIHKELNMDISIRDIFENQTVRELAVSLDECEGEILDPIGKAGEMDWYPASSAQKRIYMLSKMDENCTAYNTPFSLLIEGELDREKLESAFIRLIERHEIFRTGFHVRNGEIVQVIRDNVEFNMEYDEAEGEKAGKIVEKFIKPFDLSRAPLLRIMLLKESTSRHMLLVDMHHIITDGISIGIMMEDLAELYKDERLPELGIQYKDYALWQKDGINSERLKMQGEFWLKNLSGEIPLLNMPLDFKRPSIQSFEGDKVKFWIDTELFQSLGKLASETVSTLYMVILAAYNVFLAGYTGQQDIIVGSPVAGRIHPDLKKLVGMFVNTLAIRNFPEGDKPFAEFLQEVKQNCLNAYENQEYPFEEVVESLNIKRDISRNPLFDTMFVLQNMDVPEISMKNLRISLNELEHGISKFDLTLQAFEKENGIEFSFEYCKKLFKRETIERMARHFTNILSQVANCPYMLISEIKIITEEEENQILSGFNGTIADYPKNKMIHELFEEQVERTPENTAVVFGDKHLTYYELNERANRLAEVLRKKGVKPDVIVAIMLERSIEMLVGIMGVLKAGGAYLPINPEYPEERIRYMVKDSGAFLILTQKQFAGGGSFNAEVINLDEESTYQGEGENLPKLGTQNNLAYVIYTSGSTGIPKGVMIEHRALVNRLSWMQKCYPIGNEDVILQKTPYTFDVSVWELLWWSISGARVVFLAPGGEKDPLAIVRAVECNNVTTIHFVPSMLNIFLEYIEHNVEAARLKSLRRVFASGEALTAQHVEHFKRILGKRNGTELYNLYGPTEAAIDVSYFNCTGEGLKSIPIGKPIDNIRLYILNRHGIMQPVGIPGELYISGDGLARGYLGKPELTAGRFVPDTFFNGERMYKTGDLARWLPDGNIEFLGRNDYQVKIRGFRIELGEIEAQLRKFEGVRDAVVTDREANGSKYLCAYIQADNKIASSKIRSFLAEKLPDYMIPASYVFLDSIPLTNSGKVDRKALPEPASPVYGTDEYSAPANKVEEILVKAWEEVLGVDKVSTSDNFFEIGGDSLAIIRVLSAIIPYGLNIHIQDFYRHSTIKELADKINGIPGNIVYEEDLKIGAEGLVRENCDGSYAGKVSKEIGTVLLTGASGFLGAHILDKLICNTDAEVYCLIRGKDRFASEERLKCILRFYFGEKHCELIGKRIHVVDGDITLRNMGLAQEQYEALGRKTDIIIHAAALVKHYGDYSVFENINVGGTMKVLEFAGLFGVRLYYISTISILESGLLNDRSAGSFVKNSFLTGQNYNSNVYIRSKLEAENVIIDAINRGADATVLRVGNLTGRFSDGQFQINISENSFYKTLKSIIELGAVHKAIVDNYIEFTPVDYCSEAIVRLVQVGRTEKNIFHIANPKKIKVKRLLEILRFEGINIQVMEDSDFIEYIKCVSEHKEKRQLLDGIVINGINNGNTSGDREKIHTSLKADDAYLKKLSFKWPEIDPIYINRVIRYLIEVRFLDLDKTGFDTKLLLLGGK